jgi:protein ImuB
MLWIGVHLPALSLESFLATLPVEAPAVAEGRPPDELDELDGLDTFGPVALIERHRLVAVNAAARECGLAPGHKRATALALAPHARLGEADPRRDAAALLAVAHVLMAFTPAVSIAADHVVLAEVQASLRYFGGPARLLERLRAALAPLGHALRVACAPTAQAAQWLAAWRDDAQAGAPPRTPAEWRACIGGVPLALMAAAAPHRAALESLGLRTAADLWRQPRAGLTRRFGAALLADIDRALGDVGDPRTALQPPPVFDSRLELFMRADDSAALLVGAAVLLQRLTAWAGARHGRVAGFELRLHHESRRQMREDPAARSTVLQVGLGEPATDTAHLQALLRERLQRLPLAASVIELSLHCDQLSAGAPPNAELFPSAASVGEGWQRLLERFEARLGAHNLQRLQPVADHRPEKATAVAHGGSAPAARASSSSADRPALDLETPAAPRRTTSGDPSHWPRLRRPVWLLAQPQPLRERAGTPLLAGRPLWLVAGPERIEAGWWDDDLAARDYFIAQGDDGALLWVYRYRHAPQEGESGWYLQGRFG